MDIQEFKKIFKEYEGYLFNETNSSNITTITDEQYNIFYKYMTSLLEWNKKINITAITNEKEFIVKHFIDSLTVNKYLNDYDSVIDIGTGAGFPGVPLKIMNQNKRITLIDSVGKKLKVIENINKELKLTGLDTIHVRAEDLANDLMFREMFDVAVTRAVSNMSTICEYMLPFVRLNGIAICMKGPNYEEELKDAQNAINILGGKIENVEKFNINNETQRNIIIIKKEKSTPKKYPRGQGKPLKEPIK